MALACNTEQSREPARVVAPPPTAPASTDGSLRGADDRAGVPGADDRAVLDPAGRVLPRGYLAFDHACDPGEIWTIAAAGDLILHPELQRQAYASKEGHLVIWGGVRDLLERADVTYLNLEGPVAPGVSRTGARVRDPGRRFDNRVYTGWPRFNYHASVFEALVGSGVDVVSTANNHALDRGSLGADRTLDGLDRAAIEHAGTRRADRPDEPWFAVTRTPGLALAWVACTLHTNGQIDEHEQVLPCFEDSRRVVALVRELAGRDDIDGVVVTPHWGDEYQSSPNDAQRELARALVDAGALVIVGSHPHVLQPWDRTTTSEGREALVVYSLGNFASHQKSLPRRASVVMYVGLGKDTHGNVHVRGAAYVPINVRHEQRKRFYVEAVDRAGGPEDTRALVTEMFGAWNLVRPDGPLVTNPHCDPSWPGWSAVDPAIPAANEPTDDRRAR